MFLYDFTYLQLIKYFFKDIIHCFSVQICLYNLDVKFIFFSTNKDFFNYTNKIDWIISNPPFSILNNVLDHCSLISKKGFGLIMLSTALTIPRINKMKQKGFKITKLLYFQVKKWFGFTCVFVVFSKTGDEIFNIEPKKY